MEILSQSIQAVAKTGAVVAIATHDLARFGALAERALILHQGDLYKDSEELGSCEALFDEYRKVNR
jgi:ABC-type cobalamin transport system ATPase subunit